MPLKWKIFRIANYLHLALMAIFILSLAVGVTHTDLKSALEIATLAIISFCFLVEILFAVSNLVLLEKFYPEKLRGKTFSIYNKVLLIITLLIIGFWVWSSIEAIIEEFIEIGEFEEQEYIIGGQIMASLLAVGLLFNLYLIWFHLVLRKNIRRNFESTLSGFLQPEQS